MREQSSTQGELGAKARECPPSVLPAAAAPAHLSPPAILAVCALSVHSLGSPFLVSCVAFGSVGFLVCLSGCPRRWPWSEGPSSSLDPFSLHTSPHEGRRSAESFSRGGLSRG